MPDPIKLRPPQDEEVNKVIATGFSIVVGLTNDRQMTFQSGFEGDEDDSSIYARMRRMMGFADKLKATYEIPEIEDELFKHRETLANFVEDRDRVETSHAHAQAERRVQIDETNRLRTEGRAKFQADMDADILKLNQMRKDAFDQGLEAFRKSGRQGSYVPKGQAQTHLDRIDKGIEQAREARDTELERWDRDYDASIAKLEAEIERAEAEKEQALQNIGISITRYEDAITEREDRLAKRKLVAEG